MAKTNLPPGVFIDEINAFPNSVVPVATAVPAFIGYTEKAVREDYSLHLKPTKISSLREYSRLFGEGPQTKFEVTASEESGIPFRLKITESYFTLYHQMRLFFANGGADCYIVSVGGYTRTDGTPGQVEVTELQKGIEPLLREMEPTLLVIPELTTAPLDRDENGDVNDEDVKALYGLYGEALTHCGVDTRSRFAIMDVRMDRDESGADDYPIDRDIALFRSSIDSPALAWGAAYYPWLQTTVVSASEVGLLNVANRGKAGEVSGFPDGTFDDEGAIVDPEGYRQALLTAKVASLVTLLDKELNRGVLDGRIKSTHAEAVKTLLEQVPAVTAESAPLLTQQLRSVSPVFEAMVQEMCTALNLLPPSAAMAGIYAMVDNSTGVFQSPANVAVGSVARPAVAISNDQQADLNVPLDGKAVNAIRAFPGMGALVWGARTLDGNSLDWRYISVRRTVIFIEQSVKRALETYAFEPNTAATWTKVEALVANFLNDLWKAGALAGATAEDASGVDVGLGSTMTPEDIMEGYMRVDVKVALTHPAEYIVITIVQKMQ